MTVYSQRASLHTGVERRSCAFQLVDGYSTRGAGPATADGWELNAYASLTNCDYVVNDSFGSFTERIMPGAFRADIARGCDVVLLANHRGLSLARTRSGTLSLAEDHRGLKYSARLSPTSPDAQALRSAVERGDLTESSFSFRAVKQTWNAAYDDRTLHVVSIDKGDCGPCNFAASPATGSPDIAASFRGEARADKYTDAEVEALAKQGKAFRRPNGQACFPCVDAEDIGNAVIAVGGRGGADAPAIRRFVMARAKTLGVSSKIPASWTSSGTLKQSNAAGRLGEHRSPLHANVTGSHTHRHSTLGSSGWKTHVHEHAHDGDASHDHTHDALAQAAADADAATSQFEDPTQTLSSSSSLAASDWDYEARIRILRYKAAALPESTAEERRAAEMADFERRVARQVARAAALHPAVTGIHTHSHPAFGSQGSDESHEHEHAHEHDSRHDHHDTAAEAADKAAPNPGAAVNKTADTKKVGK